MKQVSIDLKYKKSAIVEKLWNALISITQILWKLLFLCPHVWSVKSRLHAENCHYRLYIIYLLWCGSTVSVWIAPAINTAFKNHPRDILHDKTTCPSDIKCSIRARKHFGCQILNFIKDHLNLKFRLVHCLHTWSQSQE